MSAEREQELDLPDEGEAAIEAITAAPQLIASPAAAADLTVLRSFELWTMERRALASCLTCGSQERWLVGSQQ